MTELLEIYNIIILTWMALMLTIQSFILWKLLPEIIKVAQNTEIGKAIIEAGKEKFIKTIKEKFL